jgi:1,3-alpha-isomaltosidase
MTDVEAQLRVQDRSRPVAISHRPLGSGHPYRIDPDQIYPVQPIAGEAVEFRVLCDADVEAVTVDIADGEETRQLQMEPVSADELYGQSDIEGHLSSASGSRPDIADQKIWRTVLGAVSDSPQRYRFRATSNRPIESPLTAWFDLRPGTWTSASTTTVHVIGDDERVIGGSVESLVTIDGPVRVRFALHLDAGEHVVGFGERFDRIDQRGTVLDTVVFEQYKQQGARTYLPSPFAIVAGGDNWGFHVDTTRRVWFDVGASQPDRLIVETTLDPYNPTLTLRTYDGSPVDVLAAHLADVGKPVRPPDWVFRPWMSANEWNTQARVLAEVERSIDLHIPVGAVVIEAWSDESTFVAFRDARYETHTDGAPHRLSDFEFPQNGAWPDPRAMVDRLHELGVKVLLWQIPLVPTDRGNAGQVAADANTMIERGYCVHEASGDPHRNRGWWFPGALLPDWTNPEATEWWLAKRRYLLDDLGIDGFKTDGGEHAWGDELRYHDGSRGATSNNVFANRYAAAYHQLIEDTGRDAVTFSRAGFTGAGSVPCHWAGDEDSTWEAFRAAIVAGVTAGVSGIPFWGWDLGGFSGEIPTVELFARSTAMAAFCPIMQYHSEFNHGRTPSRDRTPWNLAERHGDPRPLDIYRRYAQLRERLQPYLQAEADHTCATGTPMMRPLAFDSPDDPEVWNHPFQYLFGRSMLVAPVCWEARKRLAVYLPNGDWIDARTHTRHDGRSTIDVETPLDTIPVFVRADAAELANVLGLERW